MVPPRLAKGVARHLPRDIDAASVPCLDAEATYSLAGRRVWLRPADLSGPGSLRRKAIRAERDQMPDSPPEMTTLWTSRSASTNCNLLTGKLPKASSIKSCFPNLEPRGLKHCSADKIPCTADKIHVSITEVQSWGWQGFWQHVAHLGQTVYELVMP